MASELKQIEQAVETSMENARGSIDNYFDVFQKAIGINPWSGTDLIDKMQQAAERNVHATFEFINRLTQARDFTEVVRIQTEFAQSQVKFLFEQLKAFGEATRKVVADVEKAAQRKP